MNPKDTMTPLLVLLAGLLLAGTASAYPGGTPGFQTDAAPFCAGCHSSMSEDVLAGAPPGMAAKQLAGAKHLAVIQQGGGQYGELSEAERAELVAHIQAVDAASSVSVTAPKKVKPGEVFTVTVDLTGGAGPVVGVALVDVAHRWLARPIAGTGFDVTAPPVVIGQDFKEQSKWIGRRPEALGRNLSYVNIEGISSDAVAQSWGRAQVAWTLRAPMQTGTLPLAAAYWYGTEKASPHGMMEDPVYGKKLRGGSAGASGRVIFSDVVQIQVAP